LDIAAGPKKSAPNATISQPLSRPDAGYIVVETNYRVYAYTNSALQVALIALFCELMYRLVARIFYIAF